MMHYSSNKCALYIICESIEIRLEGIATLNGGEVCKNLELRTAAVHSLHTSILEEKLGTDLRLAAHCFPYIINTMQ